MQLAKARGRQQTRRRVSSRRRNRELDASQALSGEQMALRQVEVSAAELERARARAELEALRIDRAANAAVEALLARAARPVPSNLTVRLSETATEATVELARRDARGRVVLHEYAHRSNGRVEFARTDWREGIAHRRNLVAVTGGLRLRRDERWREIPSEVIAFEMSQGHSHRRMDSTVMENTYLVEGSALVHRVYSQQPEGRVAVTARFDAGVVPVPARVLEEGLSAGAPLVSLELHERRRLDGRAESDVRTSIWAQRGRKVTLTERDGRRHWRSEQQVDARYTARAFAEGTEDLTTVERSAQGREVEELTAYSVRGGSGPAVLQQRTELAFDESGALERCLWTQTEAGGATLSQRYRRSVRVTDRGLEVFESEQATRAEPGRAGKLPLLWRSSRQTHRLQRGALQRLLSLSEQIVDPQQNRVQAVLNGMHAWVVVNGRSVPLAGDEVRWFRSLPSRERALAVHALQDLTRHVKLRAAHGEDGFGLLPTDGAGHARLYKWEEHLEQLSTSSLVQMVFRHPSLKAHHPADSLEGLSMLSEAGVALAERRHALVLPLEAEALRSHG